VLLEGRALRPIDAPPDNEVHHLVDRVCVPVIGIVVLGKYEFVNPFEGGATKRGKGTLLVLSEDDVQAIEESGMGCK